MSAAMDRARVARTSRLLCAASLLAAGAAPGCAHLHQGRAARAGSTRLARLTGAERPGRHAPVQADPVAERLAARAGGIATAGAGPTTTRTTAPPPGAVLPADAPAPTIVADPQPSATPTASAPKPEPSDPLRAMRAIVDESKARLAPLRNYQVMLTRQESVGGGLQPEETVLLSIRREPRAVRLEWPEGPNRGREVIYLAATNGGMMHIRMPNSLVPRISMPPDSPLALRNSRHPITEAGLDAVVDQLDATLALHESGRPGADQLDYLGVRTPVAGAPPCHTFRRVTADGETWTVALDAQSHLPHFVQAQAADGSLLERYLFRDPKTDLDDLAVAAAFDPDARWGASTGLLGRLARSADPEDAATR